MSALPLRAQAFSRAGGQRFVLGEHPETGSKLSANLHRVSARALVIACPVSEFCLLSGLLEGVETVITGSVIVVLIQLPLWKSVGTFCVSVATESDPVSGHIWCCFTGSWKCLETTAWCMKDFSRPKTFTGLSHFFAES